MATVDIETYTDDNGIMPMYMTKGAACADVAIPEAITIEPYSCVRIDLKVRFNIPHGYQIKMYPRSSLMIKHNLIQPTSIIDEDYHGHVHVPIFNASSLPVTLLAGERVAQIEPQEKIHCTDWKTKDADRDQNGFGGTGRC